ncbi:hypothetical protein [Mucilaginibacter jinjuensis]|uniref:DoxX-like protein n=1 Tax=Mucilaginibacter jinjuensis TaxID=1176721 RepID=A0ABY7TCZ4_9SPHI|nr:hypothetical protein [Mucilaginibacter jinjuensis]WCT14104.1 hypothetical protein PQO05_09175 [Mucilaginibacter jinjuensis]
MISSTSSSAKWPDATIKLGQYLFAISWIVFGIEHFIYAGFVATLVPPYMPVHIFWVYLTALSMMAAGVSFIINIKTHWGAWLLAAMLGIFILMIHIPSLIMKPHVDTSWTRAIQDVSLMAAALMLTGNLKAANIGRIIFAIAVFALGCQHFVHIDFVTARISPNLPAFNIIDDIVGAIIILTCACIIARWNVLISSTFLGCFLLLLTLLYYLPLLNFTLQAGGVWTACMLNIAISGGAFLMAIQVFKPIKY